MGDTEALAAQVQERVPWLRFQPKGVLLDDWVDQRVGDGFALRVQHGAFERDVNVGFHPI